MRDVIVIGLGAMGSMAAWQAAARGASVLGVEQFDVGHARGSSHGGSRIYRQILFEGKEYVPLARRTLDLIKELERDGGRLFEPSGGLVIGTDGGELIEDALASAAAGEVAHEWLTPDDLRARYPQHAVLDDDVAIFEPGAGVLRPEACVTAAVRAARRAGADIRTGVPVSELRVQDGRVAVTVGGERFTAARVILASGAWTLDLLPEVSLPLRTQRSCLSWFKARGDAAEYRPGRFPTFVRESHEAHGWGIPDVDGVGVKVGISGPQAKKAWLERPEDNWRDPAREDLAPIEEYCATAFPGLVPRVSKAMACMNSKSPDGDFVIGPVGAGGRVVFAGGFSGHGFKHAAAVGQICAQLALDGGSEFDLSAFSPTRFGA
ncbi:N-methyl-L-tryptophan oxidase [Nonomuraea sp. NPDC050547]|uniref:N-methyl-L-tryptophan oxidase n=1 Tax=unclassified Nonomuraea TaxID=2593643 RepID=UPI0037AF2D3B